MENQILPLLFFSLTLPNSSGLFLDSKAPESVFFIKQKE